MQWISQMQLAVTSGAKYYKKIDLPDNSCLSAKLNNFISRHLKDNIRVIDELKRN